MNSILLRYFVVVAGRTLAVVVGSILVEALVGSILVVEVVLVGSKTRQTVSIAILTACRSPDRGRARPPPTPVSIYHNRQFQSINRSCSRHFIHRLIEEARENQEWSEWSDNRK
ncbi:hypothetical protein HYPBUDRAFT_152879 [Hyphopichia burtonii NRRL Y-1933]|uniref:Uncharacterized protein n=1 Tax=Hyphopichia burtonii NRRL Y-1933 TaxID=984485 RepID=A0A1E4RHU4_9ASCO|nr:hypothetical protein HYPBUDRAFT_152879 [Hyphopichia burtonii NRRL Y-1933]ODV66828.1 hypothetical protein HYPBUDRAFT_152879 [Hyphopichia burtonii NRRL Y-1933]